jgi:hypothetical protein
MTGSAVLNPDRPTRDKRPGSKFLRMTGGVSLVRYWGVSDPVALFSQAVSPAQAAAADEPMTRERAVQSDEPVRRSLEPASV